MPYGKKKIDVLDRKMAYVEVGEGDPVVFLHGNPTSSYLWRNVMPHLEGRGRLIAPDLIGMGDSDKLPQSGPQRYTFVEHRRYLDALLAALGVGDRVVAVLHDWGTALGFDWARRNQSAVRGLAYMEGIIAPVRWDEFPEGPKPLFESLRSEQGEEMVLKKNFFVEQMLPGAVIRELDEEEMNEYRRPFAEAGEGRRPTLTWPRQIPIDGEPADVDQIVKDYGLWLRECTVPKLFVNAEPGILMTGDARALCRSFKNQSEITVAGLHFVQEDSPDEIGRGLAEWLGTLD